MVKRFAEMKTVIQENLLDGVSDELKAIIMQDKRMTAFEGRVEKLENTMNIDYEQQQVLNNLGVSWNSRYVPYMMEEAQKQNLWISGDDYSPTCGDMIVVCGDNHIIMSDGGSGDWDAGCSSGVVHRSSWRAAFPEGATGYIKSSILIADKLKVLGKASD